MCHVSKNKEGFLNWAIKAGWYPYLKEQYEEAEAMHWRTLQGRRRLGQTTLVSVSHLGLVSESQGKRGEAEALEGHEKAL